MKLSIVVPAFNEAKNIKKGVLDEMWDYLKEQDISYEVLIVDDGSTDNTVELVREEIKGKKGFEIINSPHGGKALTVIRGMLKTKGEVALFTDMDQATPLKEIAKLLPEFEKGYDFVIGSRTGRKGAPPLRKLSAWGFSVLRNIILGLPFKDTQCGFKAFNRQAVQEIFPTMLINWEKMKAHGAKVNAGFDVETLFLAKKKGLKIAEIPVEWHYVGTQRVNLISDAFEAIKDMLRIRINDLVGKYS